MSSNLLEANSTNLIKFYQNSPNHQYLLLQGDCNDLVDYLQDDSIDCVITSPPYWKMREYDIDSSLNGKLIGNENEVGDYVRKLTDIFNKIKRKIKPGGSVWLNLGDKYFLKRLMGIPWRVALSMQDNGWILRNDVIWDQMKGTQSPKDRLRDIYEHVFHFVKSDRYYYDVESIKIKPKGKAKISETSTISATGVSGVRYRKQINSSVHLSEKEKESALAALDHTLNRLRSGEIIDFRMTIRGVQRAYHSDKRSISGRAKELNDIGYYILTSKASGYVPSDIWRIVPEDKWRKDAHCAVFPEELLTVPILATCPKGGIVLDPFVGTGSAVAAAVKLGRRGIGIDLSSQYLELSSRRLREIVDATKLSY